MTGRSIKTLTLIAAKGIRYPIMGRPSKHITDAKVVEVEDHAYYRKALLDGDLLVAPDVPVAATASATATASAAAPVAALTPASVK